MWLLSAAPLIVAFCCKLLHIDSKSAPYLLDFAWIALALSVHIFMEDHKAKSAR